MRITSSRHFGDGVYVPETARLESPPDRPRVPISLKTRQAGTFHAARDGIGRARPMFDARQVRKLLVRLEHLSVHVMD